MQVYILYFFFCFYRTTIQTALIQSFISHVLNKLEVLIATLQIYAHLTDALINCSDWLFTLGGFIARTVQSRGIVTSSTLIDLYVSPAAPLCTTVPQLFSAPCPGAQHRSQCDREEVAPYTPKPCFPVTNLTHWSLQVLT